jgi:hypothetical protein
MNTLLVAVAMVVGSMSPGVPQAASPDISGTWDLMVSTTRGIEVSTLTLKKNDEAFSGAATRGTEQATVEAKVKAKAVTGDIAGDTMGGTGLFGARGEGTWTAKRTAASGAADVSGTWAVVVDAGKGSEKPTLMFKQDGEKLSGYYRGQFGRAALRGTIKGNAIDFWVSLAVDGIGARLTYSGTVDKDTMKGTAKVGNLGEGTFTGTRKR